MPHVLMYLGNILFHSAIYLFFIIVPFRKAFRFRPAVTVTAIAAFVAVVAAIILLFLESEAPFVQYAPQGVAFLMAISLFTGIILIRGNPMRIFYSVLVVINIQNCAILLAKMLTRNGWTLIGGGQSEANYLLLSAIISCCFIPYLWLLAVKLLKPLIETRIKFAFWNYLWLVPMGFSILFNLYLYPNLLAKQMPYAAKDFVVYFTWTICSQLFYTILLQTLQATYKSVRATERLNMAEQRIQLQRIQYEKQQLSLEQMAKIQHDMRHHLILLQGMLKRQEYSALEQYIGQLSQNRLYESMKQVSENMAADTILRYYLSLAEREKIEMEAVVELPKELPIDENDLAVILGNLVENALEACQLQTDGARFIKVTAKITTGTMLAIKVKNSYNGVIRRRDGEFLSSKRRGEGIGIASVRNLAERYHGVANFTYQDGIFEASVLLNP